MTSFIGFVKRAEIGLQHFHILVSEIVCYLLRIFEMVFLHDFCPLFCKFLEPLLERIFKVRYQNSSYSLKIPMGPTPFASPAFMGS
jgi:hypothetical protein